MFSAIWTRYGKVKMPKLKSVAFETAIIEQYQHQESSVEEALIEMCLAGISAQRVEAITEAVWGTKVSPGQSATSARRSTGT
jgi:transposase, mutator family